MCSGIARGRLGVCYLPQYSKIVFVFCKKYWALIWELRQPLGKMASHYHTLAPHQHLCQVSLRCIGFGFLLRTLASVGGVGWILGFCSENTLRDALRTDAHRARKRSLVEPLGRPGGPQGGGPRHGGEEFPTKAPGQGSP